MSSSFLTILGAWVRRDFRLRYVQTSLGAAWGLAQPIALTATFVFLFREVARIDAPLPYASYVLSGMLLWTLFASGVLNGTNAMTASMYVASKANYPRVVAPLSAALLALADLAVGLVLLPVLLAVQEVPLDLQPLPFLGALLGALLLSAGAASMLSAMTIFVRDIRNLMPLLLQLLLLLSPVAYPPDRLPSVLQASPIATFVNGFRAGLLGLPSPTLGEWARSLLIAAAVLVVGLAYFHRVESRFTDVA